MYLTPSFHRNRMDFHAKRLVPVLLLLITLGLLFLPMGPGYFFGSESDWLSQHVAVAQSLRQTMLEQQSILPQWIGLGGGSSTYDFAYYGLLRPDVLFSCLVPGIEMKYIIAGYAILEAIASAQLTRIWLRKHGKSEVVSFAGAVLLISSSCFYQAHHQIMFVNYIPFLILGLIGTDRLEKTGKAGLVTISVVLIILHSFYYAPACICVIFLYACFRKIRKHPGNEVNIKTVATAMGAAVTMSAVLLIPTALAILSTSKDGGSAAGEQLRILDPGLEGLLYSPYGCGMTLLALYCLLLALLQKDKARRFLAAVLLAAMALPAVSLALNGFLYARAKILIPFLPLLVLVCTETLEEQWEQPAKFYWLPLIFSFAPALFSQWQPLILADGCILIFWAVWWNCRRQTESENGKRKTMRFWLILLVPVCVSLGVNLSDGGLHEIFQELGIPTKETWLPSNDKTQQHIPQQLIADTVAAEDYRYEILADSFMNVNVLGSGNLRRTSMYSSVSNGAYGTFFYDVMGNAISFNNRVALVAGKNPVFNEFMGIRYVLSKKGSEPYGYQVRETCGDYVLAENEKVRPICYGISGSGRLLSREAFERLDFYDALEALSSMTITENGGAKTFEGHFTERRPEEVFTEGGLEQLLGSHREEKRFDLEFEKEMSEKVMVLRFDVNRLDGKEVVISIGGVKNKLSSVSAPYPNGNRTFTYVLDMEGIERLSVTMSAGEYDITGLELYEIEKMYLGNTGIIPAVSLEKEDSEEGANLVYRGEIQMEEAGYFVTSYPYRNGFEVLVDGKPAEPGKVNTVFLGVELEEGAHQIEIRFNAPGYRAGCLVSIGGAAVFLIYCIYQRRKRGGQEK